MSAARKFLFDLDFDSGLAPAATPAAPPKPVEPRFSAAELEQARKAAFTEGQAAGQAAALRTLEKTAADALQRTGDQIKQLLQAQADSDGKAMRSAVATAVAILRKLQPELARRKGLVEIESVLAQCLETMREEPRILVRVHDSLLDPLRERLDGVTGSVGYEGRIVIVADENLVVGDCRVEWADGGVERDTARLWREIDAALARTLAGGAAPAAAAHTAAGAAQH
jgi:flagellar assembly protein FliH